jgi:hypothetical protein
MDTIRDVVFSIEPGQARSESDRFVSGLPEAIQLGAAQHAAKEYSTLDWIMEGLLRRAGFEVLSTETPRPSFIAYHCRAVESPAHASY